MRVAIYGIFLTYLMALAPAAVVCCRKGEWMMFILGWPTLGLAWVIGALAGQPWRRLGITAAVIVIAVAVLGTLGTRPARVLGMNGEALESSVGNGSLLGGPRSCGHWRDGSWMCSRWDDQLSGTVSYRVEVDGFGCWHARRVGPVGEGSPARLSGCVELGNYLL
jgi:hypothetical protein